MRALIERSRGDYAESDCLRNFVMELFDENLPASKYLQKPCCSVCSQWWCAPPLQADAGDDTVAVEVKDLSKSGVMKHFLRTCMDQGETMRQDEARQSAELKQATAAALAAVAANAAALASERGVIDILRQVQGSDMVVVEKEEEEEEEKEEEEEEVEMEAEAEVAVEMEMEEEEEKEKEVEVEVEMEEEEKEVETKEDYDDTFVFEDEDDEGEGEEKKVDEEEEEEKEEEEGKEDDEEQDGEEENTAGGTQPAGDKKYRKPRNYTDEVKGRFLNGLRNTLEALRQSNSGFGDTSRFLTLQQFENIVKLAPKYRNSLELKKYMKIEGLAGDHPYFNDIDVFIANFQFGF
jgi:hypothetical protein